MHAHVEPDGTYSIGNERYRVEDRGEHAYEVVRVSDGAALGGFSLRPRGASAPEVEVRPGADGAVALVARAFATPRGPLPLQ